MSEAGMPLRDKLFILLLSLLEINFLFLKKKCKTVCSRASPLFLFFISSIPHGSRIPFIFFLLFLATAESSDLLFHIQIHNIIPPCLSETIFVCFSLFAASFHSWMQSNMQEEDKIFEMSHKSTTDFHEISKQTELCMRWFFSSSASFSFSWFSNEHGKLTRERDEKVFSRKSFRINSNVQHSL